MTELFCITCPVGCRLTVTTQDGTVTVAGNECKRGAAFARHELTNPTRSFSTTVRTVFAHRPALPVRSDGEIPKGKVAEAVRALGRVVIDRPLRCGDTVAENICGCGVRVIATGDVDDGQGGERNG